MWQLFGPAGLCRIRVVFKHDKIAEPRPCRGLEGRFPIGRPEISSATERFFNAIIEVVAEGTYVGFNLDDRDEVISHLDDQIPIFRRSEVTRQGYFL